MGHDAPIEATRPNAQASVGPEGPRPALDATRDARASVGAGDEAPIEATRPNAQARPALDATRDARASVGAGDEAPVTATRPDALARTVREQPRPDPDVTRDARAGVGAGESEMMPRLSDPERIGRYVILARLGAGGMGVVVVAYDPKLDRKVAIKLLNNLRDGDRESRLRMEREAQAMARLAHPNVVTVYEVGEFEGHLFVAMEFVKGKNLNAWLREREPSDDWRTTLDMFIQAGQGLAAAHQAGIVHRDFKPDNVFVGDDGRVRVGDFGLARREDEAAETPATRAWEKIADTSALAHDLTTTGMAMGTPAYMAPEQFLGQSIDARTDQFAFCVALWEALYGRRPFSGATYAKVMDNVTNGRRARIDARDPQTRRVPSWLRSVCQRGIAVEPERRYRSMEELLAALSHGRARARTRRWLAGAAAVALAGASGLAYQAYDRATRVAACEDEGASIFEVWSESARSAVYEGLVATGLRYAPTTAEKILPILDAHAEAWREHRSQACRMAAVDETLTAEQRVRAVWCLDERRQEFAALVRELSRADETVAQHSTSAAAGLSPVSLCLERHVLEALPPPPSADDREKVEGARRLLSEARILLILGQFTEGLQRAQTALASAEEIGWSPMIASARQLEGALLLATGEVEAAERASRTAYIEATKIRAWDVAAAAATELVGNVGDTQTRFVEGKLWAELADVAISFAGDPLELREAARLNSLGSVHIDMGEYPQARAVQERALAIWEQTLGRDHPRVAAALSSLGNILQATGDYEEAKVVHERALAIQRKALGDDHPDVALGLINLGIVHLDTGDFAQGKLLFERALSIQEQALGPKHPVVAFSLNNLGGLNAQTGDCAKAQALFERSLAIREEVLAPDHPLIGGTLSNMGTCAMDTGDHARARELYERALAIEEKALGPDHPEVAVSLANLALAHVAAGAFPEAEALLHRALTIQEAALGPDHSATAFILKVLGTLHLEGGDPVEGLRVLERSVAIYDHHEGLQDGESDARFALAKALIRTDGDRARALAEARRAAAGYGEAGEDDVKGLAAVEAFLEEHGSDP